MKGRVRGTVRSVQWVIDGGLVGWLGAVVRGFRVKVFVLGGGGVKVRWSVLRAWAVLGFVELRAAAAIGAGG